MRQGATIWPALGRILDDAKWTTLAEIYARLGRELVLSREHMDARWKRNVRNILQRRKSTGEVQWDGSARYRLRSESRQR